MPCLKLRRKIGLLYVDQIDFHLPPRLCVSWLWLFARRHFQGEPAVRETLQTSFEIPAALHGLARHQPHFAATKPGVILGPNQLAVQSRRGNLQRISSARYGILHVQDDRNLAAHVGAILVGHAFWFVDGDSQGPGFASAPQFSLHQFEPMSCGHTAGNFANFVEVNRHNNLVIVVSEPFAPRSGFFLPAGPEARVRTRSPRPAALSANLALLSPGTPHLEQKVTLKNKVGHSPTGTFANLGTFPTQASARA